MDAEFCEANGLEFAYLSEGTGPLVLLLHGFPDTAHTWDFVRPRVAAKGYRAVSPFMRGYHPTAIPPRDADPETLGRDALALISALGADSAVIVGHDWGAMAAYGAASLEPSRVKKLVTVAIPHPAAIKPTPAKAWNFRHFVFYKFPGAASRFAKNDFEGLAHICKRWSPTWNTGAADFADVRACFENRESLEAAFGYYRSFPVTVPAFLRTRIRTPSVAFAGLDDPMVAPSEYHGARRMFEAEYQVEEMPGGHFMHREQPEIFTEKLLAHL